MLRPIFWELLNPCHYVRTSDFPDVMFFGLYSNPRPRAFIALTWFRKVLILVCNDLATSTVCPLHLGQGGLESSHQQLTEICSKKNSKYLTFLANHAGMKGLHHIKFGGCSVAILVWEQVLSDPRTSGLGSADPSKKLPSQPTTPASSRP